MRRPLLRSLVVFAAFAAAILGLAPARSGERADALIEQALQLLLAGKHAEAAEIASQALAEREAKFGKDHPSLALPLTVLAQASQSQGRYREAEPLWRRALTVREAALGPDEKEVLAVQDALGMLLRIERRYDEAESLLRKSLTSRERTANAVDVCQSLDRLAALYQVEDRYDAAETATARCLAVREKALGPDHPDVGQSLHALARLYRGHGRGADAEATYQRALKLLGTNHPEAILAAIRAGDYDQAARSLSLQPGRDREAVAAAVRKTFFGQVTDLRWTGYRSNIAGKSGILTIEGEAMHGNGLWQPFAATMTSEGGAWKLARVFLLGLAWR